MLKPRPERGIAAENAGFAVCYEDVWCKPSLGKSLAGEVIYKDSGGSCYVEVEVARQAPSGVHISVASDKIPDAATPCSSMK